MVCLVSQLLPRLKIASSASSPKRSSIMPILKVLPRRLRATPALVENFQQNKKDSGIEDTLLYKGAG